MTVELGSTGGAGPVRLFGITPSRRRGSAAFHDKASLYKLPAIPVPFTGRLLLGTDCEHIGRLHMGFTPAWLFTNVWEIAFDDGHVVASHDRSAEMAEIRVALGEAGLKPAPGEESGSWVNRTFSLSFDYSWPRPHRRSWETLTAPRQSERRHPMVHLA
ncbi:hypothetical protein ACFQX7_30510 [Luedemannella flava]